MGTFEASFPLSGITGQTNGPFLFGALAAVYDIERSGNSITAQMIATYLGDTISLDGDPAIPFASITPGFNITAAVRFRGQSGAPITLGGYHECAAGFGITPAVTNTMKLEQSSFSRTVTQNGTLGDSGNYLPTDYGAINVTGGYKWADLNLFIRITATTVLGADIGSGTYSAAILVPSAPVITGSYQIITNQWELTNLSRDFSSDPSVTYFAPGDRVKLHNSDDSAGGFDTVTEIEIVPGPDDPPGTPVITVPAASFEEQTTIYIIFIIPEGVGTTRKRKTVSMVNPTLFTGDAVVDTITILTPNRSGIYILTENKRNDTLYIGDGTNTTEDVKIPRPFFKTGFIGG